MKTNKILNIKNIGGIVVLLVAISTFYFLYFLYYIPNQENALRLKAFRILKEYGNNMNGKYTYYQKHIDNFSYFYIIKNKTNDKNSLDHKKTNKKIESYTANIIAGLDENIEVEEKSNNEPGSEFATIKFDNTKNNYIIPFGIHWDTSLYWDTSISKEPLNNTLFLINLPVPTLMENLKYDHLFDNIILFDSNKVIYNSHNDQVQEITKPKTISDSVLLRQGGFFNKVEVRGQDKYIIVVPLTFFGKQYYLAGFITEKFFNKKTRAINNQFVMIVSGILLLFLIAIPVIKVLYVNRYERLRAKDASNATISLLGGAGLLVLISISLLKFSFVDRNYLQTRLVKISDTLYRNVNEDLNALIKIQDTIVNCQAHIKYNTKKSTDNSLSEYSRNVLQNSIFDTIPKTLWEQYLPINEILVADEKGKLICVVSHTHIPDSIDISQRLYFQNAINPSKSWYMAYRLNNSACKSADSNRRFYIESIQSYNTLNQEAAISFPLDNASGLYNKTPGKAKVIAITSHIPSLYDQVLPEDIHFMVINEKGQVLFHSDHMNNLHENFLDECDQDTEITGAMEHRIAQIINITYDGKKWLARILPIEDTPLYHITMIGLEYSQKKNSRIFLFTFYFLIITIICIIIGMQAIQHLQPRLKFMSYRDWSFKWLFFNDNNFFLYSALLKLQIILLFGQLSGFLLIEQPVLMLIYQLVYITFSGFASYFLLKHRNRHFYKFWIPANFATTVMLLITMLLIFLIFLLKDGIFEVMLPLTLIILMVGFSLFVLRRFDSKNNPPSKRALVVFQSYMLLWLSCLVIVPVISYYWSIDQQENNLWNRYIRESVAKKNIDVMSTFSQNQVNNDWYHNIQGNGIDNLSVKIIEKIDFENATKKLNLADSIYFIMSDPAFTGTHLSLQIKDKSYHGEWKTDTTSLNYSKGGMEGQVSVTTLKTEKSNWILYLIFPLSLILLLVWLIYRYLSENILSTIYARWVTPKTQQWDVIVRDKNIDRILLISFFHEEYLLQMKNILSQEKALKSEIQLISLGDLVDSDIKIENSYFEKNKILWIIGLNHYIHQVSKHKLIIRKLVELNQNAKGKIILCIPFELDYIFEIYDDLLSQKEDAELLFQKQNWNNLFGYYHKFTGTVKLDIDTKIELQYTETAPSTGKNIILGKQNEMEAQYNYIWSCLTITEKMILLDLAEEGLLNLKNKFIINRLLLKGLILYDENRHLNLFDKSFRYHILFCLNTEELKMVEQKMTSKGHWRSARNLILIVIFSMAGFVLISQGVSIKEVIGIFGAFIALFSSISRLAGPSANAKIPNELY